MRISKPSDIDRAEFDARMAHPEWCCQQKIDGVRVIVRCDGGAGLLTAETKTGLPLSPREAKFFNAMRGEFPLDTDYTFDGELAWGHYYPFDELTCPDRPYRDRLARVHELVDRWQAPHIRRIPCAMGDARAGLWSRIVAQRVEGAVLWNLDAPWRLGSDLRACCKFKVLHRVDVVLMEMNRKRSAKAFVYDREGQPVPIGNIPLLSRKAWSAVNEEIRLRKVVVAEIEYRHRSHNGVLVEPRLIRFRADKSPAQCTIDQHFHEAHAGELDDGPSIKTVGAGVASIAGQDAPESPTAEVEVAGGEDGERRAIDWGFWVALVVIALTQVVSFILKLGAMQPRQCRRPPLMIAPAFRGPQGSGGDDH